jgi:hypothetical protein
MLRLLFVFLTRRNPPLHKVKWLVFSVVGVIQSFSSGSSKLGSARTAPRLIIMNETDVAQQKSATKDQKKKTKKPQKKKQDDRFININGVDVSPKKSEKKVKKWCIKK